MANKREKLKHILWETPCIEIMYDIDCALDYLINNGVTIEEQPTADIEEVKHGQWMPQILLGEKVWHCSECKTIGSPQWKRCPICEAKMDGENISDTSDEDLHKCTGHLFRQVKIKRKWNE